MCPDSSLKIVAAQAFDDAPAGWHVTLHDDAPVDADVVVAVGDATDVAADVSLDPAEPERVLEEIRSRLETSSSRVIAVVGASAGCGVTSIALHLAAVITETSCVVDLQPRPSCARRLGIDPADVTKVAVPVPIPGASRLLRAQGPVALDALRRDFERVILDTPAERVVEVRDQCEAIVLVTTPNVVAASYAGELLDELGDTPVAIVTNRLGPGGETTRAELQRILGRRIALELPCSRALRDAEDDCRLMTSPWSPWLHRIRRLSAALAG